MKTTIPRSTVYLVIDCERDYQDSRWDPTLSNGRPAPAGREGERSIDEFTLYINEYAARLQNFTTASSSIKPKLDTVRKIAALCVACMEQHGVSFR